MALWGSPPLNEAWTRRSRLALPSRMIDMESPQKILWIHGSFKALVRSSQMRPNGIEHHRMYAAKAMQRGKSYSRSRTISGYLHIVVLLSEVKDGSEG